MRISTNQVYQRGLSNLLAQQEKALRLEEQLSSGLKVKNPSDNPIASSQIELMNQRLNITQLLQNNRQSVESSLNLQEGVLSSSVGVLQKLKEIQIQAANGSLSGEDRKTLGIQAQSLLNQLKDFANTKDINGNYMFSGGKSSVPPIAFDSGNYVYRGDSTQRFQAVAENLQVAVNNTGDNLFMRIPCGNGRFSIQQPATPNFGTAVVNLGSVVDPGAYIPGNYTVNFTTDTAGQLMVSATLVSGEPPVSSEVLAPTPYVDGSSFTFNGMEMSVTGAPQAGDSFSISCSDESVFSTIQRMITNLNKPYGNVVSNAVIQTENTQIYSQLDNAFNTILNYQSDLGARLNQLDSAESSNSSLILVSQETLKQLREINPTEVAVQYNLQLVNLQAAQQSFVRIQGLSVFNYL